MMYRYQISCQLVKITVVAQLFVCINGFRDAAATVLFCF